MNEDTLKSAVIGKGEKVGHMFCSYGFQRAHHGKTQIGSTASVEDEELREFTEKMCRIIETRLGGDQKVVYFFGGFYASSN